MISNTRTPQANITIRTHMWEREPFPVEWRRVSDKETVDTGTESGGSSSMPCKIKDRVPTDRLEEVWMDQAL